MRSVPQRRRQNPNTDAQEEPSCRSVGGQEPGPGRPRPRPLLKLTPAPSDRTETIAWHRSAWKGIRALPRPLRRWSKTIRGAGLPAASVSRADQGLPAHDLSTTAFAITCHSAGDPETLPSLLCLPPSTPGVARGPGTVSQKHRSRGLSLGGGSQP